MHKKRGTNKNFVQIRKRYKKEVHILINKSKCQVAGIGVMKGVQVALCGAEYVNLLTNAAKILRLCFSYEKKLEKEFFLDYITKLQKVINIWKITILALSKIIHLALVTNVPTATLDFLWGKNKIKHDTLCNHGGLKSEDIFSKIVSLQCSWIRRLCNENFCLLYLIEILFGKNFKFHPDLDLRNFSLKMFLKSYQEIIYRWSRYNLFPRH